MKACSFEEQLVLFAYGELDAASSAAFERHLENCPSCRSSLAALKKVSEVLSEQEHNVPDAAVESLAAAARKRAWLYGLRGRAFKFGLAAAGAAAVAALLMIAPGKRHTGTAAWDDGLSAQIETVGSDVENFAVEFDAGSWDESDWYGKDTATLKNDVSKLSANVI